MMQIGVLGWRVVGVSDAKSQLPGGHWSSLRILFVYFRLQLPFFPFRGLCYGLKFGNGGMGNGLG